jgi:hypothetical protein
VADDAVGNVVAVDEVDEVDVIVVDVVVESKKFRSALPSLPDSGACRGKRHVSMLPAPTCEDRDHHEPCEPDLDGGEKKIFHKR